MPSDRKKKAKEKKAQAKKDLLGTTAGDASKNTSAKEERDALEERILQELENPRSVVGVMTALPDSRDVQIDQVTVLFHGHEILQDAKLEFNYGRRYGLLGPNGCGKTTLLTALGNRELPIQDHIDTYFMAGEIPASDLTALEAVMKVDVERERLEKEAEELALTEMTPEIEQRLDEVYHRLDEMGSDMAEARAASILHGLGFDRDMQQKKCRDFSGGWRMRISLARALYINPTFLILDEPTNHLDLEACVWLEEKLKRFNKILLMVSHSQDFLNNVCTNIIHMQGKKCHYYSGNYDQFLVTKMELDENQMKRYKWEQNQIADMKNYIARFGHGSAKLARQAQSKEKVLQKMIAGGLTEQVSSDRGIRIRFKEAGKLPPPVLQFVDVSFGYSPDKILYEHIELGVDSDSRVALVGPNGAGKSTLLKLMTGTLEPTGGMVKRHNHLKLGQYHQHLTEMLDLDMSAIEWMGQCFNQQPELMRPAVGRFGITGRNQTMPMRNLSDGLRCRVTFAWLAFQEPNMLLLDEPTNHLDLETIDSLAEAINAWDGGVVLVSHDFRLISQVAEEIWVVNHGVERWDGDIISFKEHLKSTHAALADRDDMQ